MPSVVHAAWLRHNEPFPSGRLFLWAEDLDFSAVAAAPSAHSSTLSPDCTQIGSMSCGGDGSVCSSASGRLRDPKIPSHPAQIPVNQLRAELAKKMPEYTQAETQLSTAVAWLPTQNGLLKPRQSAALYRASDRLNGQSGENKSVALQQGEVTLDPWQITGLTLSASDTLLFLTQLNSHVTPALPRTQSIWGELSLGKDLLFWSSAAKHALEILVGQHYLPVLRAEPSGRFLALWQPILLEPTIQKQFADVVEAMPPICRAYNLTEPADAPSPESLAEHFVASLVDNAIRTWGNRSSVAIQVAEANIFLHTKSAVLQWIDQLLAPHKSLNLPPQPVHQLYREWQVWVEQLHASSDTAARICFELCSLNRVSTDREDVDRIEQESKGQGETWQLHYFLQIQSIPDTWIPAHTIWQTQGNILRVEDQRLDRPRERLLAGLGAASRMFKPIERSLRSPNPEMALLSTEEAYDFLREIGPLLERSGFIVRLPDWWSERKHMRLGLRLRLFGDDIEEPNDDVDYLWELTLGGEVLAPDLFKKLAAAQTPLQRVDDQWMELDPTQVSVAQNFLQKEQSVGSMRFLDALRLQFAHLQEDPSDSKVEPTDLDLVNSPESLIPSPLPAEMMAALPLDMVEVQGWLARTLNQLRTQEPFKAYSEPEGFIGELRPYQKRGVGWLAYLRGLGLGACLADDMGLGKTIQAIGLLLHEQNEAKQDHRKTPPALLICPTSVVANWRREVERFAPSLQVLMHHGNGRLSGEPFWQAVDAHDFIITSYGTARRDIELLDHRVWNHLILDEAQNIKNPGAKQTQAVRRLRAHNRIALTGTPVENRLAELWSIIEFLNPGYLGGYEHFRKQYIVPIERYNDNYRVNELRRIVQPFLLRRLKSDPDIISDLPEKNEMVVYCSLTAEQEKLYDAVVRSTLAAIDDSSGIQRRGLVLGLLTKLKQIANHPAHYLKEEGALLYQGKSLDELRTHNSELRRRSGKLSRLTEMLEEALAEGDQSLIFTQFVEMGKLLHAYLHNALGVDVLFLHGGTSAKQRDQMVQLFQSKEGPPIFILSLRAGGAGINLTRANRVFHFDRWWNPAVENQATDRAFRIGQKRSVQVHKFVSAGTLEERIQDLIERKKALAETIVGSGEDWLTELDTEQLQELLSLRHETLRGGK